MQPETLKDASEETQSGRGLGKASWTPRKQFTSGGARGGALATRAERVRVEHIKEKGVGSDTRGAKEAASKGAGSGWIGSVEAHNKWCRAEAIGASN